MKIAEFAHVFGQVMSTIPGEITRSMNRFSSEMLTRQNLTKNVETIHDVPVDGDTIAHYRTAAKVKQEGADDA